MERTRWQAAEEIFHAARGLPGVDQERFVRSECGGDEALCEDVMSLLRSLDTAQSWLETSPAGADSLAEIRLNAGDRVGAYSIEREIGEGGMGCVYLAARADEQFEKRVAIKVVKAGVRSELRAANFRRERQILAALEHPNIVRLLDGGLTPDLQPYLVMELVEGAPIEAYCEGRKLNLAERLRLFRKVCEGVQYAHRRLIIHRDLKPSNILVTAEGEPKILDFGIATLAKAGVAPEGPMFATRLYASPELLSGKPVTTATDVYSLGRILKDLAGADVPRDLARIMDTALRESPDQRYQSVELLSEDIRRHLAHLPLLGVDEPLRTQIAKFVRRHRAATTATAVVAASLVTATVVSLYEYRVAQARLEALRKLTGSVLFEFHDSIQNLTGATRARHLLTQRALEYLNGMAATGSRDPRERLQLAEAYRKIGDVQGNPTNANLGDISAALASYAKAMKINRELLRQDPGKVEYRRALALLLQRTADTEAPAGEVRKAVEDSREALAMFTGIAQEKKDLESAQQAATAHIKLGDLLGHPSFANAGDRAGAVAQYTQALAIYSGLEPKNNPVNQRYLGLLHERLGRMQEVAGESAAALASYRKSFDIRQAFAAAYPANTNARRDLAIAREKIGDSYIAQGKPTEALPHLEQALQIFDSLHALDTANANATRALAIECEKTSDLLLTLGRVEDSRRECRRALDLERELLAADPVNRQAKGDVLRLTAKLGR